jgi:TRAP-type uncharacterized transport system substrate-binding protein
MPEAKKRTGETPACPGEEAMGRLWIILTAALVALAAVAGALAHFIQLPPRAIVMAAGPKNAAYYRFGLEYAKALRRDDGMTVVVLPTRGAVDNVALLHDANAHVVADLIREDVIAGTEIEALLDAGLITRKDAETLRACKSSVSCNAPSLRVSAAPVQGGIITGPDDARDLASLGTVFYEPLWLFGKHEVIDDVNRDGLGGLKGRKVAVGADGSGTQKLALELLRQHGIDGQVSTLLPLKSADGHDQLQAGNIDVALVVAFSQADIVKRMFELLREGRVELGRYPLADAYADLNSYLYKVVLHRATMDLANDLPRDDTPLIAAKASLLVRSDLHSATQYLLLNAAKQIHGRQSLLQRAGEFPAAEAVNVPLSRAAQQFYSSSVPYFLNNFLRNYLPFWIAEPVYALIPILILIGALGFLRPLVRPLPVLVNWWTQRTIFRLLAGVMALRTQLDAPGGDAGEMSARHARLDKQLNRLLGGRAPAAYAATLLMLRERVDALGERLRQHAATAAPGEPAGTAGPHSSGPCPG